MEDLKRMLEALEQVGGGPRIRGSGCLGNVLLPASADGISAEP